MPGPGMRSKRPEAAEVTPAAAPLAPQAAAAPSLVAPLASSSSLAAASSECPRGLDIRVNSFDSCGSVDLVETKSSRSAKSLKTDASIMRVVQQRISRLELRISSKGVEPTSPGFMGSPASTHMVDEALAQNDISSNHMTAWTSSRRRLEDTSLDEPTVSLSTIVAIAVGTVLTLSCASWWILLEVCIAQVAFEDKGAVVGIRIAAGAICACSIGLCIALSYALGALVSRPMRAMADLMQSLGDDSVVQATKFGATRFSLVGRHGLSRIEDVRRMQAAYSRLWQSVEIFQRYLPESVMRGIVRGDDRASRLHVSRREVTIMFSDLQDFTAIAESLRQEDLLFVLTRYLSIISRIVEAYEGVVAEILGDGVLAYWNTPDTVAHHAAKACAAALAQLRVLGPLNEELSSLGLPSLAVRIGLHTGIVLTGNIGSESKMKFGCMGDPVNLASRLEGLCKVYGVSLICSGDTYNALIGGFCCRKLDLVKVKGKTEPTAIYEVIGLDAAAVSKSSLDDGGEVGPRAIRKTLKAPSDVMDEALSGSTQALESANVLAWNPLSRLGRKVTKGVIRSLSERTTNSTPSASPKVRSASRASSRCTGERTRSQEIGDEIPHMVRTNARRYESALQAYQLGNFVSARDMAQDLLDDCPGDRALHFLLQNIERYIGPDGITIAGLTAEELASWTGITVMTEK